MLDMKNRMADEIQNAVGGCARHWAEIIADHLIARGAVLPPCKAGDELDGKIVDQVTYKTMANFNGSITTVQEVELRRMDENRHIYTTTTISFDEAERLKQEG